MQDLAHNTIDKGASVMDAPRHDPYEDDEFTWKHVTDKELLDHEHDLFTTKWFDYRQLTPLQATRHYIDAFGDIYRRYYAINFDRRVAQFITPISVDNIWAGLEKQNAKSRRAFIGCWRGRQCADAIGMPYEVYIDIALKTRLDYWQQPHPPQPVHLYSEMVVEKAVTHWEELQASRLFTSEDPAYMVQNYRGLQHQDDYHEWLFAQAKQRSNPPAAIASYVNDNMLPLDKVEARFDETTLEQISRHLH